MIMISAQETTPGQAISTASLTSSTTSYDLSEFIFDKESFSPSMSAVSSNNNDASHPYISCQQNQINQKFRAHNTEINSTIDALH